MLCPSLPHFIDERQLRTDPLAFLEAARATGHGLVFVSEQGPVFSHARQCPGAIAVFNHEAIRRILGDPEVFGMAASAADRLMLPRQLANLNASLFSMEPDRHRSRRKILVPLLAGRISEEYSALIAQGIQEYGRLNLHPGSKVPLVSAMRSLMLHVAARLIFGSAELEIGHMMQAYFDARRRLARTQGPVAWENRRDVIRKGARLDRAMRKRLAACRESRPGNRPPGGLLGHLLGAQIVKDHPMSEDELVAHANVLFLSSSEPVAVALAWTLLLLSQQRHVRRALIRELKDAPCPNTDEQSFANETSLLGRVLRESLRLLPPNAVMLRIANRRTVLLGHELPQHCELIVSPYVLHRDPEEYERPTHFDESRWNGRKVRPLSFLPFGSGARHCLGKNIAIHTIAAVLTSLLRDFEVILSGDQDIDWKLDVMLMPETEPIVEFRAVADRAAEAPGGRLGGSVTQLVSISTDL